MILNETYTLSNGVKIPKIGFGVWKILNDDAIDAVKNAINIGYRHIDTAQSYMNEEGVGKGIKLSGIDRKELFITTKVRAEHKSYELAKKSIDESLEKLGVDYLDLVIIHAPEPWAEFHQDNHYFKENIDAYKALEDAYKEGKVRAIGVSNFLIEDLENIINNCEIKPMVQILTHISNTKFDIIEYCKKNNILVEAYSPIAHGYILQNEELIAMAKKYNVSVAQLCIKYTLELGLVSLPKAQNPSHIRENTNVDFELEREDFEKLKNFEKLDSYGELAHFPVYSGR